MSIVNFENLKVTTMTAIINLEGTAIIESAFQLLPITRLVLPNTPRTTKKFKIPWPGKQYAGHIFSAKFQGITRGISKSASNKSFRNSISIDICTSEKNIAAKLSNNKIHMCGPNSEALAFQTANLIVNQLIDIQNELDYMSAHILERDAVLSWLIQETKGSNFVINADTQEIITLNPGETIRNSIVYENGVAKYNYKEVPFKWDEGDSINGENIVVNKYGQPYYRSLTKKEKKDGKNEYPVIVIGDEIKILEDSRIPVDDRGNKINKVMRFPLKVMEVTSIKLPESLQFDEDKLIFPSNLNQRICKFLIRYISDYAYHHVLCGFFDSLRDISRVYLPSVEGTFRPSKISIAMINYSYSLKMNIDRWQMAILINGYEGFHASYNNTTDHHVTITLPYTPEEGETIKRKALENCHTLMVYRSGIVTQSGPSPKMMEPVYYKFMNFVNSVRDQIRLTDNKPFNLKYRPTSSEERSVSLTT